MTVLQFTGVYQIHYKLTDSLLFLTLDSVVIRRT